MDELDGGNKGKEHCSSFGQKRKRIGEKRKIKSKERIR